jgi:hypothetical protein
LATTEQVEKTDMRLYILEMRTGFVYHVTRAFQRRPSEAAKMKEVTVSLQGIHEKKPARHLFTSNNSSEGLSCRIVLWSSHACAVYKRRAWHDCLSPQRT